MGIYAFKVTSTSTLFKCALSIIPKVQLFSLSVGISSHYVADCRRCHNIVECSFREIFHFSSMKSTEGSA